MDSISQTSLNHPIRRLLPQVGAELARMCTVYPHSAVCGVDKFFFDAQPSLAQKALPQVP